MESSSTNSSVSQSRELALIGPSSNAANPFAVGISIALNGAVLALLLLLGARSRGSFDPNRAPVVPFNVEDLQLLAWKAAHIDGGGGGTRSLTDPTVGKLPKAVPNQFVAPQIPVLDQPKLEMDPSIVAIKVPDDPALANIGVPRSPNVTLSSNGQGIHGGMGTGSGDGDGPGDGNGAGPGGHRGIGLYGPGSGVKPPTVISAPTAEFSDEARRSKYQGVCLISLIVDAQGNPQSLHVARHLGMGLDEKALEAVAKYRFKPATLNGKPVASMVTVEVNFRLF